MENKYIKHERAKNNKSPKNQTIFLDNRVHSFIISSSKYPNNKHQLEKAAKSPTYSSRMVQFHKKKLKTKRSDFSIRHLIMT